MLLLWIQVTLSSVYLMTALPLVDPGLFVISGVKTCGNGNGYCLLGLDCTLDEDFVPDDQDGHCEGLKYAFTPSAHFVCCKAANISLDHSSMIFPGEETSTEEEESKQNTSTPNVMENEIEQVLLKLAESINTAKYNLSNTPLEETELSEEDDTTMINNGTEENEEKESPFKNESEEMTESSYEESEIEDMLSGGENLTNQIGTSKPDLTGDQAYGQNNTNVDAEWMEQVTNNADLFEPREDIINKLTMKTEGSDEINDVVISTLDKNEQLNNLDASFYSIMQKEHLTDNEFKDDLADNTNSSSMIVIHTSGMSGENYNQSVTSNLLPSMNTNIPPGSNNNEVESGGTTWQPDKIDEGQIFQGHYQEQVRCADRHDCTSVKFMYLNNHVCFGSILSEEWVLTSGSCALRIFRIGMLNVTVQRLNSSEEVFVRTIVVHENYREPTSENHQLINSNNIGLIRIKNPMESWRKCLPCLPYLGQDFSGSECSALFNYTSGYTKKQQDQQEERSSIGHKPIGVKVSVPLCEGRIEPLVGEYGDVTFLTLACGSMWRPRDINTLNESGAPLLCNGILAGIETSAGIGTLVYTPVSRYLGWLDDNAKPPSQIFYDG